MAESAAVLVDDVFQEVPIRQLLPRMACIRAMQEQLPRVLSFPFQLRFLLARYPELMGKVLGIVYRVLSTHLIKNGELVSVAKKYLGQDERVRFIVGDGEGVIKDIEPSSIDIIFADTWPGKYNHLDETLALLNIGGLYVVDDMLPQDNWPEGHDIRAKSLIEILESKPSLSVCKLNWSTGLILVARVA